MQIARRSRMVPVGTILLLASLPVHSQAAPKLSATQRIFGAQTVDVGPFRLHPSNLLPRASINELRWWANMSESVLKHCSYYGNSPAEIISARRCLDKFYLPPLLSKLRKKYDVSIEPQAVAGVPTEIFLPKGGASGLNRYRVLINLHGGSFQVMGHWGGEIESIPIASVGRMKVVSVDYRMAPEAAFPAASEDVAAVYRAMLAKYRPEDIGIYGCSAGGILAAEATAWFQKEGLPRPGAIGMFSGAALPLEGTDSMRFTNAIIGSTASGSLMDLPYFKNADPKSPLMYPGLKSSVLARFPPSLLISSTRDPVMSSVIATHSALTRLGVKGDLHVWEGQVHCFLYDPDMRESQDAYRVITEFFEENLGRRREPARN